MRGGEGEGKGREACRERSCGVPLMVVGALGAGPQGDARYLSTTPTHLGWGVSWRRGSPAVSACPSKFHSRPPTFSRRRFWA